MVKTQMAMVMTKIVLSMTIFLDQISRIEGDLVIWSYYRLPLRNLSIFLHQAFFLEIYICAVVQQI